MKGPTPHRLYESSLKYLLLAINSLESIHLELNIRDLSVITREALYSLKNIIGREYETNEELSRFDKVFTKCGWDNQGFRWCAEEPGEDEDVFIVEFDGDGFKPC